MSLVFVACFMFITVCHASMTTASTPTPTPTSVFTDVSEFVATPTPAFKADRVQIEALVNIRFIQMALKGQMG